MQTKKPTRGRRVGHMENSSGTRAAGKRLEDVPAVRAVAHGVETVVPRAPVILAVRERADVHAAAEALVEELVAPVIVLEAVIEVAVLELHAVQLVVVPLHEGRAHVPGCVN